MLIYRQNIYEDGSLFFLSNITDGLLGFSINRKKHQQGINGICLEYINTTNQGGEGGSENTIPQLRGKDNYFNNTLYTDAWTYNNNIIGTALITPLNILNNNLIMKYNYLNFPTSYIVNNRVKGFNISLFMKVQNFDFTTKLIWTRNLGLYNSLFKAKQFSFLQKIQYKFAKYIISSNLAIDNGELYNNSVSCYLNIQRTFF